MASVLSPRTPLPQIDRSVLSTTPTPTRRGDGEVSPTGQSRRRAAGGYQPSLERTHSGRSTDSDMEKGLAPAAETIGQRGSGGRSNAPGGGLGFEFEPPSRSVRIEDPEDDRAQRSQERGRFTRNARDDHSVDSEEAYMRQQKHELNKQRKRMETDVMLATAKCEIKQELCNAQADAALREGGKKDENWSKLAMMLKIDATSVKRDERSRTMIGFVNMMFLVVLIGCELDLYGFIIAFKDYWDMDILVVKSMLGVMPCGYLIAIMMYMHYAEGVKERFKKAAEASKTPMVVQGQNAMLARGHPPATSASSVAQSPPPPSLDQAYAKRPRTPIELRYYHFLPIFRYYLVVKEKEESDIEGIFRVNSLSSFTMGVAQLVAIGFTWINIGSDEMSIFVKINIFSQCVNWLITILYFLTPISARMGGQLKVETLNKNTDENLRTKFEDYLAYQEQVSQGHRPAQDLDDFTRRIDNEIRYIAKQEEALCPLETFDMKVKLDALRLLRRKQNLLYAKIGA